MSVYEHFRPEEKPLIDQFLDWKDQVSRQYMAKLTDFLDPRQQRILGLVIGKSDEVTVSFSGGYEGAERKKALLQPQYTAEGENAFDLSCVEVNFPTKFASLTHSELLGALIGTGVVRAKIGDLIFADAHVQFICSKDIEQYLVLNLTSVGRTTVSCSPIAPEQLLHNEQKWEESGGTVTSLRLDAVLSEIYHLPRSKVSELISRGMARVNWQIAEKRDFEVGEGDVLSLRGHGRSKIISADGLTKKNKIRLQYGKLY
ncbi:RNA-binding protein [Sporolactobacillus pectinivorans]|uniref:YlmH family RNA-binding protein n=1 Tax=Sporolactobacillus pectinivorans TaxID=1591408 RepID=UPI000C26A716|nr:YlmH/Sll1252 family protein [Sporolactobacillus pectinivorans]